MKSNQTVRFFSDLQKDESNPLWLSSAVAFSEMKGYTGLFVNCCSQGNSIKSFDMPFKSNTIFGVRARSLSARYTCLLSGMQDASYSDLTGLFNSSPTYFEVYLPLNFMVKKKTFWSVWSSFEGECSMLHWFAVNQVSLESWRMKAMLALVTAWQYSNTEHRGCRVLLYKA